MKSKNFILSSSIVAVIILFMIEQMLPISYMYKTLVKILIFISLPIYHSWYVIGKRIRFLPSFKSFSMSDLKKVLAVGMPVFAIVLGAYFALKHHIDLENISMELLRIGVTPANFILIAIYITFFNSFIEEFFFRGYIFLNLLEGKNAWEAYLFSAMLFAFYHIGIFKTWFSYTISFAALIGLFFGGIIFNWLNSRSSTILNSWLVHIFADISVMIVGLILFGFI